MFSYFVFGGVKSASIQIVRKCNYISCGGFDMDCGNLRSICTESVLVLSGVPLSLRDVLSGFLVLGDTQCIFVRGKKNFMCHFPVEPP